jgi:retinol dehydrogenase-12
MPLTIESISTPPPPGVRYNEGMMVYGITKLANVLFSNYISSMVKKDGFSGVLSNALHPGVVNTGIWENTGPILRKNLPAPVASLLLWMFDGVRTSLMWESDEGALTQIYLAASTDVLKKKITGKYFHPIAKEMVPNPLAVDETLLKEFWNFSEAILKSKGY